VNPARRKKLAARLEGRRAEILREGAARAEPTRLDDTQVGKDDDAQPLAEMSQAISSARNRARAAELARIDGALRRLAENPDDFGLCASCEEPIAAARLDLAPWVELCVECQARRDGVRGQPRRHAGDFVD
jgi:DnaK suppressor protein